MSPLTKQAARRVRYLSGRCSMTSGQGERYSCYLSHYRMAVELLSARRPLTPREDRIARAHGVTTDYTRGHDAQANGLAFDPSATREWRAGWLDSWGGVAL